MTSTPRPDDPIEAVAALAEPTRRALYDLVAASTRGRRPRRRRGGLGHQPGAGGVPSRPPRRRRAAQTEFRRRSGRTGPAPDVPPSSIDAPRARSRCRSRHAATSAPPSSWRPPSSGSRGVGGSRRPPRTARERGDEHREPRHGAGRVDGRPEPGARRSSSRSWAAPATSRTSMSDGTVCLRNCPYDALVADHRDVTCGMNLAWAEGVVEGSGCPRRQGRARTRAGALLRRLPGGDRIARSLAMRLGRLGPRNGCGAIRGRSTAHRASD